MDGENNGKPNPIKMDDLGGKPTIFGNIHELIFVPFLESGCGTNGTIFGLNISMASSHGGPPTPNQPLKLQAILAKLIQFHRGWYIDAHLLGYLHGGGQFGLCFRSEAVSWRGEIPKICEATWVFPKIGGKPPKWMVKIMENPIKMDDLGVTLSTKCPQTWRMFG